LHLDGVEDPLHRPGARRKSTTVLWPKKVTFWPKSSRGRTTSSAASPMLRSSLGVDVVWDPYNISQRRGNKPSSQHPTSPRVYQGEEMPKILRSELLKLI
jgi:hypothetical protein